MTLTQKQPRFLPETKPLWQQPTAILTGLLGLSVIVYPIVQDTKTPRLNSAFYSDVSLSAQKLSEETQKICQKRLEHLLSGDIRIDGKFADKTMVLSNQAYDSKERLNLQKNCHNILVTPPGVGKQTGTDLMTALDSLDSELQKQQTLGNNNKSVAIFAINAAEPTPNQSLLNLEQLKAKVQELTEKGNIVIFIGLEVNWQSKLKTTLSDVPNTNVCNYEDSENCIAWGFEQGRK